MVVFGHALLFNGGASVKPYSYIFKAIYSFHMTAFFLISGVLFNPEKWCKESLVSFFVNRAYRLIIPYFFFEIIGAAIHSVFSWGTSDSIQIIIKNIIVQNVYVGADWYLPTLFCGEMLLFLCCKYINTKLNILISLACILNVAVCQNYLAGQFLVIVARTVLCTGLLLSGYYLKSFFLSAKSLISVIITGVIWLLCSQLNQSVFTHAAIIGNPALFLMAGISGTFFVFGISERIHMRFLDYNGANTLPIMGVHQNVEHLIAYFFGTSTSIWFIILSFFIMYLPSLMVIPILNRVCPFLIGRVRE